MAVTITPGALYIIPNPSAPTPAQIVGTGNQWADDSDATYGEATNTRTSSFTAGESIGSILTLAGAGAVVALDVTVRAMLTTDDTTPPSNLGVEIYDASDVELVFLRWAIPSMDVIHEVSGPDFIYPSGKSLTTLIAGIEAGGAYVDTLGSPPQTVGRFRALTIYELDFTVTSTPTGVRPLRRYPPVNNGGFGPTRHYPRSVNRRVGGSY